MERVESEKKKVERLNKETQRTQRKIGKGNSPLSYFSDIMRLSVGFHNITYLMTHVFISYSNRDRHFVERLKQDLKRARVDYWIDHEGLNPGNLNWEKAIRRAIKESSAVIYVASPNAYESRYVQDELEIAGACRRDVYPVFAEGEDWIDCAPMGMLKMQYIDLRGNAYGEGFQRLLAALRGENPELAVEYAKPVILPSGKEPRNPYKGLRAFDEKDAGDFFGREALIDTLIKRVRERTHAQNERLFGVIGASGAGKSSVVRAGVLPHLRRQHPNWIFLETIVPGSRPVRALIRSLAKAIPERTVTAITDELNHPNGQGLRNLTELITTEPIILVIDQFEELFGSSVSESERQQFINLLVTAVNEPECPLTVILTLRADFYHHPMNYPDLGTLIEDHNKSVLPMNLRELRRAIEEPARLAGLTFEGSLVGDLIFDLREDQQALAGALPLLQFTLELLYNARIENQLTFTAYEAIGRVNGAIGNHAEEVFAQLNENAQEALPKVFYALVDVDERGEATRKRAPLPELTRDSASEQLVNALIHERLLLTDLSEDEIAFMEVAHEALLRSWKRLADWIAEAAEDLRLWQRANTEAIEWDKAGRPNYLLWSYERQKPVYETLSRLNITPSDVLKDFLRPEAEHKQLTLIEEFARIGETAIPTLIKAFSYSNEKVGSRVCGAVSRLLWFYPHKTYKAILDALNSQDEQLTIAAILLYSQLGGLSSPTELFNCLNSVNYSVRMQTIYALSSLQIPKIADYVINSLNDESPKVRLAAVLTLSKYKVKGLLSRFHELLKDSDYKVRQAATVALAEQQDLHVLPVLLKRAASPESEISTPAQNALLNYRDSKFIPTFLNSLNDENHNVRQASLRVLAQFKDSTLIPVFQQCLDDLFVHELAIKALAQFNDPSLIPLFVARIEDWDLGVREQTIHALAQFNDPSLIPLFVARLSDTYSGIRVSAIKILTQFNDPKLIPIFQQALQDENTEVRQAVIQALASLNDPTLTPTFQQLLHDENVHVRGTALEALIRFRNPSFVSIFEQYINDEVAKIRQLAIEGLSYFQAYNLIQHNEAFARVAAVKALGQLHDPKSIPLFINCLNDRSSEVRSVAIDALAQFHDKELLTKLLPLLNDFSRQVREAAAAAIAQLNHLDSIPPLVERLDHPFLQIRKAAQKTLEGMTIPEAKAALEEWRRNQRK
jgi:HEAT repeat protein